MRRKSVYVMLVCSVLMFSGCAWVKALGQQAGGILGFESEKPIVAPAPQPSQPQLELRSELADYVARFCAREWAKFQEGVYHQVVLAAESVSDEVGRPAQPIPLPTVAVSAPPLPTSEPSAAVTEALRKIANERAKLAAARHAWEEEMAKAAATPAKSGWNLWSPALGWWLWFGIGGVGALLIGAIKFIWSSRVTWMNAAKQVIGGVQGFLDTNPQAPVLKASLAATTDDATKSLITATKATPSTQATAAQAAKLVKAVVVAPPQTTISSATPASTPDGGSTSPPAT
jgi:hypothetical protein